MRKSKGTNCRIESRDSFATKVTRASSEVGKDFLSQRKRENLRKISEVKTTNMEGKFKFYCLSV